MVVVCGSTLHTYKYIDREAGTHIQIHSQIGGHTHRETQTDMGGHTYRYTDRQSTDTYRH